MPVTPDANVALSFGDSIAATYHAVASRLVNSLPEILAAVVLLFLGWAIAHLVRLAVRRLVTGLDSIVNPFFRLEPSRQSGLRISYAAILSRVAFWAVLLFFAAAAAHVMNWSLFTDWMKDLVRFVPRLITGLLIIFASVIIGGGARSMATRAAASTRLGQPELLGRLTQLAIIFTGVVIGVEQLGIQVEFLTTLFIVVTGVILAGAALAFGLGARPLVANVLGAQSSRKLLKLGQRVQIGSTTGTVLEITQTAILLDTSAGQAIIPASHFHKHVTLLAGTPPTAATLPTQPTNEDDVGH